MTSSGKRDSQKRYDQGVITGALCQSCGGKIEYLTKASAKLAIRRMKGKQGRLNAYRCPESDYAWHIGHPPSILTAGAVARTELVPKSTLAARRGES